jgi:protein-tyrosine phosphatase
MTVLSRLNKYCLAYKPILNSKISFEINLIHKLHLTMRILMVCLGNICRSPLAEGIMKDYIDRNELDWTVDSAGTGDWHKGNPPDPRSLETAQQHGIDIGRQRARQLNADDFHIFDHILVMDTNNLTDAQKRRPDGSKAQLELILNYAWPGQNMVVPDPYYGGQSGFEYVYDLLDKACAAFIRQHHTTL